MKTFSAIIFLSLCTGCSTHKGFVDYSELGVFASGNAGNSKFQDVGPISNSHSSWVWATCDEVARDAVRELLDIARSRGANTVYKITFETSRGPVATPTCQRRWGWFLIYGVTGLGPWMTATSVEGIAAKLENGQLRDSASIYIPMDADTYELATSFIIEKKR